MRDRPKDMGLTGVVACRQIRQPALERELLQIFYVSSAERAGSLRAPAILFLVSRPAAEDFSHTLKICF